MTTPDWTVVVLAAGLGQRYGGAKQLTPFGPSGELLSDYALQDAMAAGAVRAVFVVRPELEAPLRAHHARWPGVDIRYVLQRIPDHRTRPLGTTDAVLAARPEVDGPFVVVNADDFYGREAWLAAAEAMGSFGPSSRDAALIAYRLGDTWSPAGGVSRGLLEVDADGWLERITERHGLTAAGPWSPDQPVSMNCWVFSTGIFPLLALDLSAFLASTGTSATAECALPESVGRLVADGRLRVRVRLAGRGWIGVTYAADVPGVRSALAALVSEGRYPPSIPGP